MLPPHREDLSVERAGPERRARREAWQAARSAFVAFWTLPAAERLAGVGRLLEQLAPWIERAIRDVSRRYFLLVPHRELIPRLFVQILQRDALPDTPEAFLLWGEAAVLSSLGEAGTARPAACASAGGAPAPAWRRFNALPFRQRALLYLYLVEKKGLADVAEEAGVTVAATAAALARAWCELTGPDAAHSLPEGWLPPEDPGTEPDA